MANSETPEDLEVTGSLVVQHLDSTPDAGRGAVKLSPRGLMWQIPGGVNAPGGAAPWRHVESVARRDISVRVVWGASSGRTTLQYRGQGAARIEGMARRHLTAPPWRFDVDVDGGRWDSQWSRREESARAGSGAARAPA